MIKRSIFSRLLEWKQALDRKPLVLRGARQVGKTHLARSLGCTFASFIEVNFEKSPEFKKVFQQDLDPKRIIRDIALLRRVQIEPGSTLLFLDEIGECEEAMKALRYFYEELPNLHVISAGSLIDFVIEKIGVPVGRVQFMQVYPMSFMEFLEATGNGGLRQEIENTHVTHALSESAHIYALKLTREYLAVGGMPKAVWHWIKTNDLRGCQQEHQLITSGYIGDFSKYAKKNQIDHCELVLRKLGTMIGHKVVYQEISSHHRSRELRPALELLEKARIVHRVFHSSGNGVPLGGEAYLEKFKAILLDIALMQSLLGLNAGEWILEPTLDFINKGAVIEAFVGQELLAYSNPTYDSRLYYWHREKKGSLAEIDYLTAFGNRVIPVEVKSGASTRLKSLQKFLEEKTNSPYGIYFSAQPYSQHKNIYMIPLYGITKIFHLPH